MKEVIIYTTKTCPYCWKAKSLLKKLEIPFNEISVDFNAQLRADMAARAGKTSVPQIWFESNILGVVMTCMNFTNPVTCLRRLG